LPLFEKRAFGRVFFGLHWAVYSAQGWLAAGRKPGTRKGRDKKITNESASGANTTCASSYKNNSILRFIHLEDG
jgi:hypothetical protein